MKWLCELCCWECSYCWDWCDQMFKEAVLLVVWLFLGLVLSNDNGIPVGMYFATGVAGVMKYLWELCW